MERMDSHEPGTITAVFDLQGIHWMSIMIFGAQIVNVLLFPLKTNSMA